MIPPLPEPAAPSWADLGATERPGRKLWRDDLGQILASAHYEGAGGMIVHLDGQDLAFASDQAARAGIAELQAWS